MSQDESTDVPSHANARKGATNLRSHYDRFSIVLHWATAVIVLLQFALAHTWKFAPKPERHLMIVAHMSLGTLLAAALIVRIAWRLFPSHHVAPVGSALMDLAAKAIHYLLYALLVAEAVLGFVLRWSGNESMSVFGFLIPPPFAPFSRATHSMIGDAHSLVGWTIIVIAAGHALTGLVHHYILRDGVLMRMLTSGPGTGRPLANKR